ncbi:MAG: rhomboid family intramembrane serine protease [Nitriliruptorales bacterium]|nr:rhomboid family intramembrane serine protease [Nitriliruptorales bacterium]
MVIPLRDRLPTRRTPWVNRLLVLANVAVFVFLQPWAVPDACTQQAFFLEHAAIPAELTQGEPLDAREIALTTPAGCALSPIEGKPVYRSIITAMFLHAGWAHLLFNMLFLWIFGDNVEDRFGHLRYLGFYLLVGAIATVVFVLPSPSSPATLVGASGAIAGVLGAYLLLYPRSRITVIVLPLWFLPFTLPALLVLGLWFFLQLAETRIDPMSGGGVAYLAHVAGFVAGFLITRWLGHRKPQPRLPPVRR